MATLEDAYSSPLRAERFQKRIMEERDIDFYVNTCCHTVNPQSKRIKYLPMHLALRQAEFLYFTQECKQEGLDAATFKSRKVGVSWLEMDDESFDYLVTPGYSSIIGSYDKELVDPAGKSNMNALMPKLDYILLNLPSLIKPLGLMDESPWRVDFMRQNMVIGSQITGAAVTANFGAGGRGGKVFMDEASRCQWAKPGWESAGQTASSRHAVLTPMGKNFGWGLCFPEEYKLMVGEDQVEYPECFRIIWKDIPWFNKFYLFPYEIPRFVRRHEFERWFESHRGDIIAENHGYCPFDAIGGPKDSLGIPYGCGYDDGRGNITHLQERMPLLEPPPAAHPLGVVYPWRVREGFRYDKLSAARELDCQFEESQANRVYAVQLSNSKRLAEIPRIKEFPLYVFCDPGGGQGNAFYMGWMQWDFENRRYQTLMELAYEGRDGYFFLPYLTGRQDHFKYIALQGGSHVDEELFTAMRHPMWRPNMVIGDPAGMGAKVASAPDTLAGLWRGQGVPVFYNYEHRFFQIRIDSARRVLGYTEFSLKGTPKLNMALAMISFPEIKESQQVRNPGEGWVHHPVHSHPASAFEYFACYDPHRYDGEEYDDEAPEQRVEMAVRSYQRSDMDKVIKELSRHQNAGKFGRKAGY